MARLYLMDHPAQPLILSIEGSVGRAGPNHREDVLLVQFFLNVTAQVKAGAWGWLIDRKFPLVGIDGTYGTETQDWIDRFQDHVKKKAVIVDGRIDPIVKGMSETRIGGPYMMYLLNVGYYQMYGANGIAKIADHPKFPREVARTFTMHGHGW